MIHLSPEAAADVERVREFLDINNPEAAKRALRVIFAALERVAEFPDLGRPTEDADIRQIVIPFGAAGRADPDYCSLKNLGRLPKGASFLQKRTILGSVTIEYSIVNRSL